MSAPRFRLAAVDLDDTLLGPDKQISAANADAVHALRARGVQVVLASGRRHENMLRFHRQLGLDGPIVSCNGAQVKETRTDAVLYQSLVPADLAAEILEDGTARGMTQNFYHTDGGLYVRERTPWTDLYASRTASDLTFFGDLTALAGQRPLKIIWVAAPETVDALFPEMVSRFEGRLSLTTTDPEYLEFMALGVSKAVGLKAVADSNGLAPSEVIAFGDGNNDVAMLEWAGLGIAMDHARASAKASADRIAPPGNPETAFARAVHLLLEEMN